LVLEPDEQIYGFGTLIVDGLSEALRGTAYHLVITPLFSNVAPIEPIKHIVRNRMADGVIFSKAEAFDERIRFLIDNGFPFISHGRSNWPMGRCSGWQRRGVARCPLCCPTAR
jgi:LacI family transcriptional regulator